jgi:hypothetical protein
MKGRKLLLGLAAFVASSVGQAHAATVTVIHGINGLDLNTARELPVDIAVNGSCALKGVQFTQSTQVNLGKGTYEVTVHPSDGACKQSAVIRQTIKIDESTARASLSVVASLSADGAPQLAVFNNSATLGISVAVAVRHTAFAPPVFAKIDAIGYRPQPAKRISNGGRSNVFGVLGGEIPYRITISSNRAGGVLARLRGKLRFTRQVWRIFYVVGSPANGLEIVQQDVTQAEIDRS